MANNVKIDIIVDDNGMLKAVARDSKGAAAGLEKVGKGAMTADRNLKGAAQASSNGSKNFSKMAQGMTGGLVPAYAAVAAQVFALTAAFDFLKNAADVQNLIAGQTQFANSTGIALKSISTKLQTASQGMLSFKEAAQSAAIGAAKGFSVAQLEQMAVGAGKAATALGRNYTDTYDRLIRGVSKAEPELLDELGITLKLAEAKRKYAETIGVSADALTAAQSSQAVFVETMLQLNNQFGKIENRPNPFIQLQTTFGELAKDLLTVIMPAFTAFANFLNNNAKAAAIVFAGILGMVLLNIESLRNGIVAVGSSVGSTFSKIGSVITTPLGKATSAIGDLADNTVKKMEAVESSIKDAYQAQKDMQSKVAGSMVKKGSTSKVLAKVAKGEDLTPAALGKFKKDIENAKSKIDEFGKVSSGVFKGLTERDLNRLGKEMDKTGRKGLTTGQKIKKIFAKGVSRSLKGARMGAKGLKLAFIGVGKAAKIAGKFIKGAMRATVILGVLQQVYDIFMRIMEAPATVVKNVISSLASIAKGIQFILNNVIVRAINGLTDMLPDWIKDGLGIDGAVMTKFTFADNAEKDLTAMADKALKATGISENGIKGLEKQEEDQAELSQVAERRAAALEDLRAMSKEMGTIAAGLKGLEGTERTANVANAMATLPILGAVKNAIEEGTLDEFRAELAKTTDMSQFSRTVQDALLVADPKEINKLTLAAGVFNAETASIKDTLANLSSLAKAGDPIGSLQIVEGLIRSANSADTAADKLGEIGGQVDLLNDRFSYLGGIEGYRKQLEGIIATTAKIQEGKFNLAMNREKASVNPSLFQGQNNADFAVEDQRLKLLELENQKRQKTLDLQNAKDEKVRLGFALEITGLQQTIALGDEKMKNLKRNASDMGQIGASIGESLSSSFQGALQGLVEGTTNVKDAFASMAKNILSSLAQVITKMLAMKLLQSALGGTSFGDFIGITSSNRYGGVVDSSGKLPGYAVGGVAKGPQSGYPVELHGTEAIVPLPNGKSIPVQMQGNSGTNNVTVNVSVASDGSSSTETQSDSSNTEQFGRLVASAVQKELHREKRSGGLLNPYGVA